MNNILLFILISVPIVLFLEFIRQKSVENFDANSETIDTAMNSSDIIEENINSQESIGYPHKYTKKNKLHTINTINACPLKENDIATDYYIKKVLGDDTMRCSKPRQTTKEFNKDFFKFRDYTYNNSSMTIDPVDKVLNLYMDGDLGQARAHSPKKIRDIFDDLTSGVNLYSKPCVRMPYFDNTMHDGYNYSFMNGMYGTRDEWIYENEKEMNGGLVDKNLYGYDPMDLKQFPALANL